MEKQRSNLAFLNTKPHFKQENHKMRLGQYWLSSAGLV